MRKSWRLAGFIRNPSEHLCRICSHIFRLEALSLYMLINSVGHKNLVYKVKSISVESIAILSVSSIELDKGAARCFSPDP